METVTTQVMGPLLDLAALTLCGFAVYYILWKRKAKVVSAHSDEQIRSIVQRTIEQLSRQQSGLAPAATAAVTDGGAAVSRGRTNVVERVAVPHGRRSAVPAAKGSGSPISFSKPPGPPSLDNRSLRIRTFTESGMSVKKISEKLDLPRCEVELIAKFQQRQTGGVSVFSGL